jgi:hypothetical protein
MVIITFPPEEATMVRQKATCGIAVLTVCLCAVAVAADMTIAISVAPNVLVLRAPTNWITIHTYILLSEVALDGSLAVSVNGVDVPITAVQSSDCGLMVLKLKQSDVDEEVNLTPGTADFVVTGTTTDGDTFAGFDTIRVK